MSPTMDHDNPTNLRARGGAFAIKAALVAISFGIALVGGTGLPGNSRETSFQITYSSFPGEGGEWLAWTEQERRLFVAGFVVGHSSGSAAGCEAFANEFPSRLTWNGPEDNPIANCQRAAPHYSRPLEFYGYSITRFYRENPSYKRVPAYLLMKALADEKSGSQKDLLDVALSVNPS